ncbi:hypothetical protein K2173_015950 [Erythroxylum novogranatense]|uniref:Uncharacterized protein n=1 Tax=Erythroxylum novogranatense TaxID=1862640 RepID=A0AAV8SFI0_9ROSI|nr:hypothetical protein K2173_015950 [Erythroxylum novogranatense]
MKIFSWMQNRINWRHGNRTPNSASVRHHTMQEPCKEEFSDWPQGLLAIGTFGNRDTKENSKLKYIQENPSPSQDRVQELTPEEVGELQKELDSILNKQVGSTCDTETDAANLEWNSFLHRNPSMGDDERTENVCSDKWENKDSHLQLKANLVISRGKDLRVDKTSNAINKKSLSFLIKQMFICGNGLSPTPNPRDQVPESRMEKILRAIIHKKIYPQNPPPTVSAKQYLKNKQKPVLSIEDEKVEDGSKWVKTDSEFIVLEI